MRHLSFICLFFFAISIFNYGQEQLPTEKKVSFGQEGKLFISRDLGVYLWLSTSQEVNSEKIRLKSDSTSRYTNPMYFDTEGYNTFRSPSAVDTNTRRTVYPLHDIIFEVYSDSRTPNTLATLKFNKTKYIHGNHYYNGEVKVLLKATDVMSGMDKTYYAMNGKPYQVYSDTIIFKNEGRNNLKYYSTDRVGNREEVNSEEIYIDKTAPVSNYEIVGGLKDNFISPKAAFSLTSSDSLSGVSAIYYQINEGTVYKYSTPIAVSRLGTDGGSITFWATDYLNNTESKKVIGNKKNMKDENNNVVFDFYIDKKAPDIEIDFNGAYYKGNKYKYVSPNTKLVVNATDEKSGVDKVYYSINSNQIEEEYNKYIEFTEDGVAYIRIKATDYVGNSSPILTNAFYVDANAPKTSYSVTGPKHQVKDTLFITGKTKISLSAVDKASGLNTITYSIGDGSPVEYKEPFTLLGNGFKKITFSAKDNVDNTEEMNLLEVYIDDTPPEIFHHFSTVSIGSKKVREEEYTIYPRDVLLYVAATDKESGGEKVEYKINNGSVQSTNPVKGFTSGNYEIEITAYDVLGNSNSQTVKFAVEN